MATGQPYSSPNATTSSADGQELGGAGHARRRRPPAAAMRLDTLSPMTSMASGGGPMNVTPRSVMARAKSVFSEKNP